MTPIVAPTVPAIRTVCLSKRDGSSSRVLIEVTPPLQPASARTTNTTRERRKGRIMSPPWALDAWGAAPGKIARTQVDPCAILPLFIHRSRGFRGGRTVMRRAFFIAPLALALALTSARATERAQVPEQYKWKLTDLYPSEAAWKTAKEGIERRIPALARFQGRLGHSAESLYVALSTIDHVNRDLERLYNYSSMLNDQHLRVASHV